MGWWQRLAKRIDSVMVLRDAGDSNESTVLWNGTFSTPSVTGIQVSQQTALAASAVMACVTMLCEDIAKLRPRLYREADDGTRTDATDHYLYELLQAPNEWQNWFEFCEQMMLSLVLRGNGYAVIICNGRGVPIRLVPINADWVALWEAPTGDLFYRITAQGLHLRAMLAGLPYLIPAEDMFHIRGFSSAGLLGASRISLASEAIALTLAQEQQAARWMGAKANPSGILTTEQKLSPEAATRIKEDWRSQFGGLANTGKTAVLEQGLKFEKVSMTSGDLEFVASRNFQLAEISRIFRIPLHMLGNLDRATNSNIVQQAQEYVNYTLSGYTRRWEAKLDSAFALRKAGVFVDFDMSELLRADIISRFNIYRTGIMSMIMTPNEARRDAGLDPIEGGNVLYQPMNMAEAGSQSTGTAPDGAGRPAADEPAK